MSAACAGARDDGDIPPGLWLPTDWLLPGPSAEELPDVLPGLTVPRDEPVEPALPEADGPEEAEVPDEPEEADGPEEGPDFPDALPEAVDEPRVEYVVLARRYARELDFTAAKP